VSIIFPLFSSKGCCTSGKKKGNREGGKEEDLFPLFRILAIFEFFGGNEKNLFAIFFFALFWLEAPAAGVPAMTEAMMERLRDLEEQNVLLLQQMVPEISEGSFVTSNNIDNFTIGGSLGTGRFARVYRAQNLATKREVALKVTPTAEKFDVSREVAALRLIGAHMSIASLYSVFPASDTHAALELQLVAGTDLFEFLGNCAQTRVLSEDLSRTIFAGVAKGLSHCHSRGVVHRE
jgi:Protein kinase domain